MIAGLRSLEDVEKEVIAATLEGTRYKITQAATILGISRKTLLEKAQKVRTEVRKLETWVF